MTGLPGALMRAEIREQPEALLRLLEHRGEIAAVAAELVRRAPRLVRFVGHGSSDNAASYGVYAFGLLPGWTAVRDSISLCVYYDAELDFSDSVVIALSQSGRTPDVVEYVARARRRGAFTVAVTNDQAADLAVAADACIPLRAGPELSVAATKTYVNQLAVLALLAGAVAGRGEEIGESIDAVSSGMADAFEDLERQASTLAARFAYVGRMFVIGRGPEYATAREIALKLKETCRIAAEALTATDLTHGPVTAVDPLFPVWVIASRDASLPAVIAAARSAKAAGAAVVASGDAAREIESPAFSLPAPAAALALLSPLLSVVPGQLFAWALACAKSLDPDRPTHLHKITLAP